MKKDNTYKSVHKMEPCIYKMFPSLQSQSNTALFFPLKQESGRPLILKDLVRKCFFKSVTLTHKYEKCQTLLFIEFKLKDDFSKCNFLSSCLTNFNKGFQLAQALT